MTRAADINLTAAAITPTDRVRWGPVIAGLFSALSTLAVLGVLGAAIGLSAYDPNDSARSFGIGAGIWGMLSALIAFAVGGWVAARTSAVRGEHNGVLNGAMVWAAAIPLLAYVLSGGIGAVVRPAVEGASRTASAVATDRNARRDVGDEAQLASARMSNAVTGQDVEHAADNGAKGAWITLVSLLLGLAASAFGGHLGARNTHHTESTDTGHRSATGLTT